MLAPLLLLGLVLGYETCDTVDSCLLQVNGTRPKSAIVSTLPNGGAGYAFTTTDCIRGLIGITEPCKCRNSTMSGSPGFCYFSGNYSQPERRTAAPFCLNQNGENTFSMMNHTDYMYCQCFDPASGNAEMASIREPVCKEGKSAYVPCSTDGTNDNAEILVYPEVTKTALTKIGYPQSYLSGVCQCGRSDCNANRDNYNPYCHSEIQYCSDTPACEVDKVFEPADLHQQYCQCGFSTCGHGEKCQTTDVDGFTKYVCTYNGRSSNLLLMVKLFNGEMTMAYVFALITFICLICVILFWILACIKINQAAKVATTDIQPQ